MGCLVLILLKIFNENISLFLKPAEVYSMKNDIKKEIRIGGFVKDGSIKFITDHYEFIVTDNAGHDIIVSFKGMLPSLFKAKQMSVIGGHLIACNGAQLCFKATEVLAKHDENYKPKYIISH